ncbi:MAG: protein BatD [Chloroflexi bacterium]|nr:protein BatD [Chloroflexota bacterium]MCI0795597.1 protein BatD [Chloroflexota bacterium]MCI0822356.1 protein BatD [Chloroflexota bacterium]
MISNRLKLCIVAIGLLVSLSVGLMWTSTTHAQAFPIKASVDKDLLPIGELVTLTVQVTGPPGLPAPSLPNLNGLILIDRSVSSSISIIDGRSTAEVTHRYILQPTRTGELRIDSIRITIEDRPYATPPIDVEVTDGTIPSGVSVTDEALAKLEGLDFFVESAIDKVNPYLGEQVTFVFRFYRAIDPPGPPTYMSPDVTGFWSSDEFLRFEYEVQLGETVYEVVETRTILFPTVAGQRRIGQALLAFPAIGSDPPQELVTAPLPLEVRSLPEAAPEGYQGTVGRFSISATVDSRESKIDDPIVMTVTLTGEGNIEAMPDPVWPNLPQWRSFENEPAVSTAFDDGTLVGSRVYKRLMVPVASGDQIIPSISYTYFDPMAEKYVTISTAPIHISIEAVPEKVSLPNIYNIKAVPGSLRQATDHTTSRTAYWLVWGVPLLLLVGAQVWKRQSNKREEVNRAMRASREARRHLSRARRHEADVYGAVEHALTTYITDRLGRPVAGLTLGELIELLEGRGVDTDVVERVRVSITASEAGRFSPESGGPGPNSRDLLNEAELLISDLEREMSR